MSDKPWDRGDHDTRWRGYFIGDSHVLVNKVNATSPGQLSAAENDLVEIRVLELRTQAVGVDRTYDSDHLKAIHRHLFQDVYEWAGEVRTVGLTKGAGESFMPPVEIERPLAHAWDTIARTDRLRDVAAAEVAHQVAYIYDYINFAHPFREGNGRTQREFFDQLLSESSRGLDWQQVGKDQLHAACDVARNHEDLAPMERLFASILNNAPVYHRTR